MKTGHQVKSWIHGLHLKLPRLPSVGIVVDGCDMNTVTIFVLLCRSLGSYYINAVLERSLIRFLYMEHFTPFKKPLRLHHSMNHDTLFHVLDN